ncbi:hypothetical protein M3P19_00220 [Muricauda sp. 2012CJ35-5]|uniref:Prenyltransferase n=1 Tax=Flagellimonas spongiicola TaxID=2942208 RepID=A0ABT0PNV7_9FLAO|nr:hypothetical protein [Allomuricauda spongiicola]MCL6272407.1 hypothetical protein [Allomuricauda spongiicola]
MHYFKILFDFYLNASVHVALSVLALTGGTQHLLNITTTIDLLAFVFFGTIVCYNFIKYGVEAEKYLIVSNSYHKYIQIFSFICFGLALYFFFRLESNMWWAILILGVISTIYAIPLLPSSGNLRSLGGMKIFVVALVWAGITVVLPVLEVGIQFNWDIWVMIIQRFLLVLILILPFEIRDLKWDAKDLRTLPQVLGVARTKQLGIALTTVFMALVFFKDTIPIWQLTGYGMLSITFLLIFLLKKDMGKNYFASFWVEGIPVFWFGLLLMLERWI